MNRIFIILIAVSGLSLCIPMTVNAGGPIGYSSLDFLTAFQVVWMHDQERLAMDSNQAFYERWGEPLFASIAASKPRYMDKLMNLIDWYDIEMFGAISNDSGVYMDSRHADAFDQLLERGKDSLQAAYVAAAYVEEWNIKEYRQDIEAIELGQCNPCQGLQMLREAYADLLSASYVNLSRLASQATDYEAQMLSQTDVDKIIIETTNPPEAGFEINGGLTDAWYNPSTSGQGFFIAVYEKQGLVFLSWLTYDTDLPEPNAITHVGDAGQRWLTAEGTYVGDSAELVVYSSSGGLFDVSAPALLTQPIGNIELQFQNCSSGTVIYDLMSFGISGSIPIRRLAPDNATVCKIMTPLVP